MSDTLITPARRSVWGRLYHGETTFDFVGRRRIFIGISLAILVVSAFFVGFRGLNLGIDFKGGVSWEVPSAKVKQSDVVSILGSIDFVMGECDR